MGDSNGRNAEVVFSFPLAARLPHMPRTWLRQGVACMQRHTYCPTLNRPKQGFDKIWGKKRVGRATNNEEGPTQASTPPSLRNWNSNLLFPSLF